LRLIPTTAKPDRGYHDIMVFADALLAQRIEAAEAANARACSPRGASVLEVAGGCAIFTGADSPLTHAVGIGLNGAVTEAQIGALETFFRSRDARPTIDLCPWPTRPAPGPGPTRLPPHGVQ